MKRSLLIIIPLLWITQSAFVSDPISDDRIYWMTYEEVLRANEKQPKKVFIDVYTDWCGWCKRMDQTTFRDPKIITRLNGDFYAVKLDAESDKTFDVDGKSMSYRQLARSFQATAYPTTVYLNEDLSLIQAVPGYQQANNLEMILAYFGENHHLNTAWPEFQKKFQSEN
jgi:thioredoxin-related protein